MKQSTILFQIFQNILKQKQKIRIIMSILTIFNFYNELNEGRGRVGRNNIVRKNIRIIFHFKLTYFKFSKNRCNKYFYKIMCYFFMLKL